MEFLQSGVATYLHSLEQCSCWHISNRLVNQTTAVVPYVEHYGDSASISGTSTKRPKTKHPGSKRPNT
jgi:hypothetical protein